MADQQSTPIPSSPIFRLASDSTPGDYGWLNECFTRVLRAVLEADFVLPYYCTWISVNGSVMVFRIEAGPEGVTPVLLVEHPPDGFFRLPVNVMITDARGEAARVLIRQPDDPIRLQ